MIHRIEPGSTIGIIGSGQLGRMLTLAARRMGYHVIIYSPEANSPAGSVATSEWVAPYEDEQSLSQFAEQVDVVGFEFENIPHNSLSCLSARVPVRPSAETLFTFQHRLREKTFLSSLGLPVPRFFEVHGGDDLKHAAQKLSLPFVLKTAGFGYDGKGQQKINSPEEVTIAAANLLPDSYIAEEFVTFEREVSMIAARSESGEFVHYGLIENHHCNHILDISVAPPIIESAIVEEAARMVRSIFDALRVVGLMCVEFFLLSDGKLLINEVAPRPHNSGHLTIEGCVASQFEQQLRAICGLPLGDTRYHGASAMVNLLGDLWGAGVPQWSKALSQSGLTLHLYQKQEARAGRKMGHMTVVASTIEQAREAALKARLSLQQ